MPAGLSGCFGLGFILFGEDIAHATVWVEALLGPIDLDVRIAQEGTEEEGGGVVVQPVDAHGTEWLGLVANVEGVMLLG